jgi:hypothetical protein
VLSESSGLRILYGIGKGGRSLLGPVEKKEITATSEVLIRKCTC